MKKPNPQGKGLVPIMESLLSSQTQVCVPPKHIEQISSELFTSLFVLHSKFSFKPVVGKSYWLYRRKDNSFHLSMIEPVEWGHSGFGQTIGECVLQQDLTWTLQLDIQAADDEALLTLIAEQRAQLETAMRDAQTIDEVMPVYLASLPFYQRVFASALANSLSMSMQKSGIQGLSYAEARGLLTKDD